MELDSTSQAQEKDSSVRIIRRSGNSAEDVAAITSARSISKDQLLETLRSAVKDPPRLTGEDRQSETAYDTLMQSMDRRDFGNRFERRRAALKALAELARSSQER